MFSVSTKLKDIMERNVTALIKEMPDKVELNIFGFSSEILNDFFKSFGATMEHLSLDCHGIERKMLDELIFSIYDHCKSLKFVRFRYAPFENAAQVRIMEQQLNKIDRNIDIRIFPFNHNLYSNK